MNKLLSCRYNMDTNRVEARFEDGTTLAIDCIAVEDEYGNTPAQRAELDWLPTHEECTPVRFLFAVYSRSAGFIRALFARLRVFSANSA